MKKTYVVRKGLGYWEWADVVDAVEKDWWTRKLGQACHFTSGYAAKKVADRTGGVICELIAVPVDSKGKGET